MSEARKRADGIWLENAIRRRTKKIVGREFSGETLEEMKDQILDAMEEIDDAIAEEALAYLKSRSAPPKGT